MAVPYQVGSVFTTFPTPGWQLRYTFTTNDEQEFNLYDDDSEEDSDDDSYIRPWTDVITSVTGERWLNSLVDYASLYGSIMMEFIRMTTYTNVAASA